MSEKKCEMERKLQSLLSEREGLGLALDEATDRIVMLEHQAREQELQVLVSLLFVNLCSCISALCP